VKATKRRCCVLSIENFDRVECFIDVSFTSHPDGYSHSGVIVAIGETAEKIIAGLPFKLIKLRVNVLVLQKWNKEQEITSVLPNVH